MCVALLVPRERRVVMLNRDKEISIYNTICRGWIEDSRISPLRTQ